MNNIYITSDTHFNHSTMVEEQWRKFKTIDEMNKFIINQWNSVVDDFDTVYHLGDVAINKKEHFYDFILPKLKGNIVFIKGNHDNLKMSHLSKCVIEFKGKDFELVHNPYDTSMTNSIVLHGHIHKGGSREISGCKKIKPYINVCNNIIFYNCNLEFHKYKPKLLNEILGEIIYIVNK